MTERRTINAIAREILNDWRKPNYGAVPYLRAMLSMETVDSDYGFDSGRGIIGYFLNNASTWRGETARRVKAELRSMLKG